MSDEYKSRQSGRSGATYKSSTLFVGIQLNRLVQDVKAVGSTPILGVLKLTVGIFDDPSASAEVTTIIRKKQVFVSSGSMYFVLGV